MPLPNFADYRDVQLDDDLTEYNLPLAEKVKKVFEQCLVLPEQDVQLPLLVAYGLLPSAMTTVVPVLLLSGDKGSGKSTAMKVIAAIHNQCLLSAATSAVAIRNHINDSRWEHPQLLECEKNTLILFDNVSEETFKNEFLYMYFLNGYDRETDNVMISSGVSGVNSVFKVYSPKVVSTIHSILNNPQFGELARRCLVIRFEGVDSLFTDDSLKPKLCPLDTINLSTLPTEFNEFWNNEENLKEYASTKKRLYRMWKKDGVPKGFTAHNWVISVDLLVTGCAVDLWDVNGGLSVLRRYWEWYEDKGKPPQSPLYLLLEQYIDREMKIAERIGVEVVELSAKELKIAVLDAAKNGQLDVEPRSALIGDTMRQLGWSLEMNRKNQLTWRKKR